MNTEFTLARAREIGVNCAFKKLGYCFGGRLKKNSLMPTGYESMNVWYKDSALLDLRFDK